VSEGASAKFLARKLEPSYPHEAKVAGVKDDVIFRIVVGTNGRVKEIHLRRGKPILIEAAAKALSQWQYKPYVLNGTAVEFETFATVRFQLPVKHH
jgi:protein TonB